jgi:hypothetical protein
MEEPCGAQPAHIQIHGMAWTVNRGHTLQMKLTEITTDAGSAVHCFAHFPDTSLKSLHLLNEVLVKHPDGYFLDFLF